MSGCGVRRLSRVVRCSWWRRAAELLARRRDDHALLPALSLTNHNSVTSHTQDAVNTRAPTTRRTCPHASGRASQRPLNAPHARLVNVPHRSRQCSRTARRPSRSARNEGAQLRKEVLRWLQRRQAKGQTVHHLLKGPETQAGELAKSPGAQGGVRVKMGRLHSSQECCTAIKAVTL